MQYTLIRRIGLAVVAMTLLAAIAPAASGQSDQELRRENQRLQGEVERLQRELDAAMQQITELRAEIERLRQHIASGGGGDTSTRQPSDEPEEEKVSIDESKPEASPRALLKALQASYAEAVAGTEMGAPDSRERELYLRQVDAWTRSAQRDFRMQVEWTVKILRQKDEDRNRYLVEAQAVDPVHGTKLGDPFDLVIPKARSRGIDDWLATYVVRGAVTPQIRVNPERETAGTFDFPKLVGPYAEYLFTVDASSIVKAEPGAGG